LYSLQRTHGGLIGQELEEEDAYLAVKSENCSLQHDY
jgi:hypothetical protein